MGSNGVVARDGTNRRRALAGTIFIVAGVSAILSSHEYGLVYAAFGVLMLAAGVLAFVKRHGPKQFNDAGMPTSRPESFGVENGSGPGFAARIDTDTKIEDASELQPDPERGHEPTYDEQLVLVTEYQSGGEAEVANTLLRAEGIPSSLTNRTIGPSYYAGWSKPGEAGNILLVPRPFLAQAQELLGSKISDEELAKQAAAEKPPPDADEQN